MSELIAFVLQHPIAVLVFIFTLAFLWFLALCIGAMPPLEPGAGWWARWGYACAQIFAANIKAAAQIAGETKIVRQAEQFLLNADGSSVKEIAKQAISAPAETAADVAKSVPIAVSGISPASTSTTSPALPQP